MKDALWFREVKHFCGGFTVMAIGQELGIPPIIVLAALACGLSWWERWNMKDGQTWTKLVLDVCSWALGSGLAAWLALR